MPWKMTCEQCGNRFTAAREHGRFCSTACRQASHRDQPRKAHLRGMDALRVAWESTGWPDVTKGAEAMATAGKKALETPANPTGDPLYYVGPTFEEWLAQGCPQMLPYEPAEQGMVDLFRAQQEALSKV